MTARQPDRRARLIRWLLVLLAMTVIFVLSAQPGLRISDDPGVDGPLRHFAHVVAYAVLAGLVVLALARSRQRPGPALAGLAVALAVVYGVTDEFHQSFVPGRTSHAIDVVYDAIGAVVGVSVVWAWARWADRRRIRTPPPR